MKKKTIRVLVTGGPTRAYLDRVRYLSNFSTGGVAYELCRRLKREKNIAVALVAGPTAQPFELLKLDHYSSIETTEQMHAETMRLCKTFRPDYAIFSAAVLDFTPKKTRAGKVSSKEKTWTIELKPTPKIIDEVGRRFPTIKRVGFKLEWVGGPLTKKIAFAKRNLADKKLDALCLNFLSELKGTAHPALLCAADGSYDTAASKRDIAEWITRFVATPPPVSRRSPSRDR